MTPKQNYGVSISRTLGWHPSGTTKHCPVCKENTTHKFDDVYPEGECRMCGAYGISGGVQ